MDKIGELEKLFPVEDYFVSQGYTRVVSDIQHPVNWDSVKGLNIIDQWRLCPHPLHHASYCGCKDLSDISLMRHNAYPRCDVLAPQETRDVISKRGHYQFMVSRSDVAKKYCKDATSPEETQRRVGLTREALRLYLQREFEIRFPIYLEKISKLKQDRFPKAYGLKCDALSLEKFYDRIEELSKEVMCLFHSDVFSLSYNGRVYWGGELYYHNNFLPACNRLVKCVNCHEFHYGCSICKNYRHISDMECTERQKRWNKGLRPKSARS